MAPSPHADRPAPRDARTLRQRNTRRALSVLLAAGTLVLAVTTADAKPTPIEKCRAAKNRAAGKYAACLQAATANLVTSADSGKYGIAREKCRATFFKGWVAAEAKATKAGGDCTTPPLTVDDFDESVDGQSFVVANALAGQGLRRCGDGSAQGSESCDGSDLGGATCVTQGFTLGTLRCASGCTLDTSGCFATRCVDNGDGTVTDHQTGLQWEQKTTTVGSGANAGDPHDVDNVYTWTAVNNGTNPDGTAFTEFLGKLNGCTTSDGSTIAGGFAGHCDWRLPTVVELQTIVDSEAPGCTQGSPCIDGIFGPTAADIYWSSTTADTPTFVWFQNFNATLPFNLKKSGNTLYVRAVRAGS